MTYEEERKRSNHCHIYESGHNHNDHCVCYRSDFDFYSTLRFRHFIT